MVNRRHMPNNMATKLAEVKDKYKTFVLSNQELIGNVETGIRVLSYFIPGQSFVLAELLYATSNLLIFINDAILRQATRIKLAITVPHEQLCSWLTVLEHVEVFLELAAGGFGGDVYRWLVIFCVHVVKAVIKFILLLKYDSGILQTPAVAALKRRKLLHQECDEVNQNSQQQELSSCNSDCGNILPTFTLPSSGRKVRTLKKAPPLTQRRWQLPSTDTVDIASPTKLSQLQTLGECLHIIRPLSHILSMYVFGSKSWRPWLLAGGLDASSLYLLGGTNCYNKAETTELRRRRLLMLLYLLRSPFYDRYTKERLLFTLGLLTKYVPGVRLIIHPLLEYLPWWQKVYFYVWMT